MLFRGKIFRLNLQISKILSPKYKKISQNMSENCILCTFICFVWEISWLIQESGRFCLYPGDSRIIWESWHRIWCKLKVLENPNNELKILENPCEWSLGHSSIQWQKAAWFHVNFKHSNEVWKVNWSTWHLQAWWLERVPDRNQTHLYSLTTPKITFQDTSDPSSMQDACQI